MKQFYKRPGSFLEDIAMTGGERFVPSFVIPGFNLYPLCPLDQHRVAKAEEAIVFPYRMSIRPLDIFDAAERGHEH